MFDITKVKAAPSKDLLTPDNAVIDRTTMNAWEDEALVAAVKATGRKKITLSGLWTEVCLVLPALSALEQGYEVYVVSDASGGVSPAAHEHALQRMIAAGAVPVTWVQVLLELQRDWARQESYGAVMEIVTALAAGGGQIGSGLLLAAGFLTPLAACGTLPCSIGLIRHITVGGPRVERMRCVGVSPALR
ncbi:isochorismatase family protein [Streptomyces sp. NPDC017254]|uniref:isochorismatase family protein n=1 Tax=unclassified Streptomyces TaxID=2593676 RepID=UPI003792E4C7